MSTTIHRLYGRRVERQIALAAFCLSLASCASTVDRNPRRDEHLPPAGVVVSPDESPRSNFKKASRSPDNTSSVGDQSTQIDKGKGWGGLANISTSAGGFGW